MMSYDFTTTTHGKWILAGEHSVLRGHGALVFPIPGKTLTLSYTRESDSELNAIFEGTHGADTHLLFWSVLEQGQQLLGKSLKNLTGHFHVINEIPIGVGMGASAALCVALARWFSSQGCLNVESIYSFARNLEDLFHGKSSGLDIAGVSFSFGVYFKEGTIHSIQKVWSPHWFLSSCGQIGMTSHCINQVQELWGTNPTKAQQIDLVMQGSVEKATQALAKMDKYSLLILKEAMTEAANCFKDWGLVSDNLQQHMNYLMEAGALAVKPTGSGGGGYVVSLWDRPPRVLPIELISI